MKRVVCLLLLIVLSSDCSDNDKSSNPKEAVEIWPLKIGNRWVLEDQLLDSVGNVLQLDTTAILIAKDTTIEGGTWYIATANGSSGEMLPGQIRDDGMWGWDGDSAVLVWKYPATIGDVFIIGFDTVTTVSIDTSITVPAGTFVCINYRWKDNFEPNRIYQYHFLSPGVGYVCAEEYYRTAGGTEYVRNRSVLLSYDLQ